MVRLPLPAGIVGERNVKPAVPSGVLGPACGFG
jgi:hypothetical protein